MATIDFAVVVSKSALGTMPEPQSSEMAGRALGQNQEIRILSVSSTEDDHAMLGQILHEMPFLLTTTGTCREASMCLGRERFGVVLCEDKLPDGAWIDLLHEIAEGTERPILIVTSRLADESLWAEVLNLGGYDLLTKPFSKQEVRHVLTSAWVQRVNPVSHSRPAAAE